MKKVEQKFLNQFSNKISNTKSFEAVKNKIDFLISNPQCKKRKNFSIIFLGITIALLIAIIPTTLFFFMQPKIIEIEITNKNDLVIEYEKNTQFINSGIIVNKKLSNGKSCIASKDEIIIDCGEFNPHVLGNYNIEVFLKKQPKIKTSYEVTVIDDEILNLESNNYRKTYYIGEDITVKDFEILKNVTSGKQKVAKYTEYDIDTSSVNTQKAGTYPIQIFLNSNKAFSLSYEIEYKPLKELNIDGKYGYIDTSYSMNQPTILALKIEDNYAYPSYSEIVLKGELKKEIQDGNIVIFDNHHSQKMIFEPFNQKLIISGLTASDSTMECFKLQESDFLVALNGTIADKEILYVAQNGHLSLQTINHLKELYGGIYLDSTMNENITEFTIFNKNTTINVGNKNIGNDDKLYLGSYYNSQNEIVLKIQNDSIIQGRNSIPYTTQLIENDIIIIRTSPYNSTYHYDIKNDNIKVYSVENIYLQTLEKYDNNNQIIVGLINSYTTKFEYVVNKGEPFNCTHITRNEIEYYDIPEYHNEPLYESIVFLNITKYIFSLIDLSDEIYGTYEHYLIFKTAWSVNRHNIDYQFTYWYEIYDQFEVTELGWVEFSNALNNDLFLTFHPENKERYEVKYEKQSKTFDIQNQSYPINLTPYEQFDFLGTYIGEDGSEVIVDSKGRIGIIQYFEGGKRILYQNIYMEYYDENCFKFYYLSQNDKDERVINHIEFTKENDVYVFKYNNTKYYLQF